MSDEKKVHQEVPSGYTGEILLRRAAVLRITSLTKTDLYDRIKAGEFPKPVRIGKDSRRRGWVASKVAEWVRQQIAESLSAEQAEDEVEETD